MPGEDGAGLTPDTLDMMARPHTPDAVDIMARPHTPDTVDMMARPHTRDPQQGAITVKAT